MLLYLALAFTVGPLVECGVLLMILRATGWEITVGIVLLTGIIGGYLAKRQGWQAWAKIQRAMREGRLPGAELMHGFLILIAGVLLVTPGVMTDLFGFLLLLPAFREYLGKRLMERLKKKILGGSAQVFTTFQGAPSGEQGAQRPQPNRDPDVIDVEAKPINPDELGEN